MVSSTHAQARHSTAHSLTTNGSTQTAGISRYVALGDSFTEGVGDPHHSSRNGLRGWADRVASQLAQHNPGFQYANLAVRGRTMDAVIADQIQPATLLNPDLITMCAGMNDLVKMRTDLDAMMARYAEALERLQRTGARVLTFTAADLGTVPLFRRLRGRSAIYNELLRAIADDLGIHIVDFWRFAEYRDPRMWDTDRVHLSPLGHQHMAGRVLDALSVPRMLSVAPDDLLAPPQPGTSFRADVRWATAFAAPWVVRRVRRMTPGAGIQPKSPSMTKVV
jgi:lysophospholipase L1-like esterase